MVIEVNSAALAQIIEENSLVIVDFYGKKCAPCAILLPMYEGISEEVSGAVFTKVCVDDEPELAAKYTVMSVPTVIALREGEVVASGTGIQKVMPIYDKLKEALL
jgi:thioredoxin 1